MRFLTFLLCTVLFTATNLLATDPKAPDQETGSLEVLFIGNSYTARHNLAKVVKAMAEEGDPGLTFNISSVIYGGRRLVDHWRLGTQHIVNLPAVTPAEIKATIASLKKELAANPKDGYAKAALPRQRKLLEELEMQRKTWDVVVLQSYRDDVDGDPSLYAEYAPRFAELAKAQGARVILYETTPKTQNAEPLTAAPDPAPVMAKEKAIAALADRIGASVAPMALVGLRCQTERPDLTLRFINDAHLNHTMAYLTACTIYAALFDRSPEGLAVDSITDIRFLNNDERGKDRDGNPITRTFSEKDRADLQRIAWEGYSEFQKMRSEKTAGYPAPRLVEVKRIWDEAAHNAFTDLLFHDGRWYCVFREGSRHVSPDGSLRVIVSEDGETWESLALVTHPIEDLRDAKLSVMPDGRLMLNGAGMQAEKEIRYHSFAWFSEDKGKTWSKEVRIGDPGFWLWRAQWHKGFCYSMGYRTDRERTERIARFYRSRDGKNYEALIPELNLAKGVGEDAILFREDDSALCLFRHETGNKMAFLGKSKPPYNQWDWTELNHRIGGPNMIQLPDGNIVAVTRLYDGGPRTSLSWLDPEKGSLTECLKLPSGGDTSYAGLVWKDELLWISYYSSHEEKTCIYLAKVAFE